MEKNKTTILAMAIILSLALNAVILGRSLQRFNKEDRTISVKGFSEREVKSDLAVYTIRTRIADNDLSAGTRAIEESKNKLVAFLQENGIAREEIIQKDLVVNDKKAQEYTNPGMDNSFRFILDNVTQVRSTNVEIIEKVSRMTDELLKRGVVVSNRNEFQGAVRYYYTRLNDIKPEMLSDATRNAKNAALQFAMESNTKLGKLKRANQGLFTILDRDESLSGRSDYASGVNDLVKKVRVVVSVEYSIE